MRKLFLIVALVLPAVALGQGVEYSNWVQLPGGGVVADPSVAVCSSAADTNTTPCSPKVAIYNNECLLSSGTCNGRTAARLPNPMAGDAYGNYDFWAASGDYTVQAYKSGITTRVYHVRLPEYPSGTFNVKAYGAVGNDSHDDTAAIVAAYDAMPSCNLAGTTYTHCGTVYLPRGIYKVTSQIAIDSAGAAFKGDGAGATEIDCHITGGGGCFYYKPNPIGPYQSLYGARIESLWIEGANTTNGNGLQTVDSQAMIVKDVSISDFRTRGKSSGACWRDQLDGTASSQAERRDVDVTLTNCLVDWNLQLTGAGGGNTFGYGHYVVKMGISSGDEGIVASGIAGALNFAYSNGLIIGNLGGAGDCIKLLNSSTFEFGGTVHCEQTGGSGGNFFSVDATSHLFLRGSVTTGGALRTSVASGGTAQIGPYSIPVRFAELGACVAAGQRAWVTDSTTATWGAKVTGGGTYSVGVICDGTNWTVWAK